MVLLLLLYAIYQNLVRKPLNRVLEQRRERTEGAVLKARADVAAAEAELRNTSRSCAKRGWRSSKLRKRDGNRRNNCGPRPWLKLARRAQQQIREAKAAIEQDMAAARTGLQAEIERLATDIIRTILKPAGAAPTVAAHNEATSSDPPGHARHLRLPSGGRLWERRIRRAEAASPANATAESSGGGESANAGVGAILANTTEQAAHTAEKWGRKLGIGPNTSFAISIAFNFLGIALICYVLVKSKVPQAFRERTASIQKSIKEAQAASADAARRLSDIEARLAKLDTEVAEIRTSAEREAAAEEERIQAGCRRRQAKGGAGGRDRN